MIERQKDRETEINKNRKDRKSERQKDREIERQEMQIYYQLKIYLLYSSVNLTYISIIGLYFKRKRGAEGGRRGPKGAKRRRVKVG
jgi:hypothetical protein